MVLATLILCLTGTGVSSTSPKIISISHTPDTVGPGMNLNITANLSSEEEIDEVRAILPDDSVDMKKIHQGDNYSTWKGSWTVSGTEDRVYTSFVKARSGNRSVARSFRWEDPYSSRHSCSGSGSASTSVTFSDFVSDSCSVSSAQLDVDVAGDIWDGSSEDIEVSVDGNLVNSDPAGSGDRDTWSCSPSSSRYTGAYDGDATDWASDGTLTVSTSERGGSGSAENVNIDATLSWSENCNSAPEISGPEPAQTTGTSPAQNEDPRLEVEVNDPDGDPVDVTFFGDGSDRTAVGEAGRTTDMNNDNWYSDSFTGDYGKIPLIFVTTQTTRGGQDPSSAHLRGIDRNGFETQHCEFDGGNSCDTHNREDNGWLAVDPSSTDSVTGLETGSFSTTSGSGSYAVSFETMSQEPLVFTQSQTSDGAPTRNTQAMDVDAAGATVEFCEQDSTDSCEGHTDEKIAWMAVDPSQLDESAGFEYGSTTVHDSNWDRISFDHSFSDPVVIVDVQTENGGQEALYPEVDDVSSSGADIRYCESESGDSCDTHAGEEIAWLAVETGTLELEAAGNVIGTDSGVSGTAATSWDEAVCGASNTWSVSATDGETNVNSPGYTFDLNCNDPPSVESITTQEGEGHSLDVSADVSDPDGNLDRCEFAVSSDSGSGTFTDNSPGSECGVEEVSYSDIGSAHTEEVDIQVTVYDTAGESDASSTTSSLPNHAPSVGSGSFTDYIARHGFNFSTTVEDPDADASELDTCIWDVSTPTGNIDRNTSPEHISGGSYRCGIQELTSDIEGFEVGQEAQISLEAVDIHGSSGSESWTHRFRNRKPQYSSPRPPNGSTVSSEEPEISIAVDDVEDSPLKVYFMDSSGDLIGTDTVRSGRRARTSWSGLQVGRTHNWYVRVSDGYTNSSSGEKLWNFTKSVSGRQRLISGIQDRYTSVITSVNKTSYITYLLENPVSSNKTVDLTLEGVNARFPDGSDSKTVELGPYSRQKFQLSIKPETNGTAELGIEARDRSLGVSNFDSIEVLVKELNTSTSRVEEIPGLTILQLAFVSVLAALVQLVI